MKKLVASAFIAALLIVHAYAQNNFKVTKIGGIAELGNTKSDVLRTFGTPDSPQKYDFYYEKTDSEIIVTFNDKTKLVESIILRGNPKYTVSGVGIGATRQQVKNIFGTPEKKYFYNHTDTECWFYPSKNLGFAFENDKVASFSVNNCNY